MAVNCGPLAGMTPEQLKAALAAAQEAYTELQTGNKGVSFSYAQGDGTRSVTFQGTSLANLQVFIQQLQQALGICTCPRIRYQRFRF
ncbi:phage head-tail adapter protein [Serratia marcescens]|uniref:gpW family head-tail joining protein n=1 Tax=Serratia marcescens TaxID=615 RepID=UPI00062C6C7B|nr:gpW family head-tail joining protein [Serratia marcescens]KKZ18101.1 phage head-tail adapter protein [Serratia marcescens]